LIDRWIHWANSLPLLNGLILNRCICKGWPNGFIVSNQYGENKLNYMRRIYSQCMYKVKTKNKCGYKLFSVFIKTVDRSHNKINTSIKNTRR
jgi:hypothetical protein